MVGCCETFFGAFFIAAGIANISIGLLSTLPILLGSLLQAITPWGINWTGSYRSWAVFTAGLQAASLLSMAILCWANLATFWTLLPVTILYWGGGMASGPAWNSWMEFLIPPRIRTKYLSTRMRICQICLLIAICATGLLLRQSVNHLLLFAGLFGVGGILRSFSTAMLGSQTESPAWLAEHQALEKAGKGIDNIRKTAWETLPFFIAIQFAVYVSAPYFTPFMLRAMGMDYGIFMFLIVLGYLGRVLTLNYAGEIAKRWGIRRLLWLGGAGLIPLAVGWWFHQSLWFLIVLQLVGGVAWGFYELAMSLVFLEMIPGHLRSKVLSIYGVLNGVAMVSGSMLGGCIIYFWPKEDPFTAFLIVFTFSSILRLTAFAWFPKQLSSNATPFCEAMPENLNVSAPMPNGRPLGQPFAELTEIPELESQTGEDLQATLR